MIGNIYNFAINSQEAVLNQAEIIFSLDKPSGDLGAYKLYKSYDAANFELVQTRVDTLHEDINSDEDDLSDILVVELNNIIYFKYVNSLDDIGMDLYFKMIAVSSNNEESTESEIITFHNYTSIPTNLQINYDSYNVILNWDNPSTDNGINEELEEFSISRSGIERLSNFELIDTKLESVDFTKGKYLLVWDNSNRSMWYGLISTKGEFDLVDDTRISFTKEDTVEVTEVDDLANTIRVSPPISNKYNYQELSITINDLSYEVTENVPKYSEILELNDVSDIEVGDSVELSETVFKISDTSPEYIPSVSNLKVMIEDDATDEVVGSSIVNSYNDNTYTSNTYYFYKVRSVNKNGDESLPEVYPIHTVEMNKAYPFLRPPGNSDTDIIKLYQWRSMKASLVDSTYYDKERFAMPYLNAEMTNLKGFLGVSDCNVDVWLNDKIINTVKSDEYGEFEINYHIPKGETFFKFQARDKNNISFSKISIPFRLSTKNIYTTYGILSKEFETITNELDNIRIDRNIEESRYTSFTQIFEPLIELVKSSEETNDDFMDLSTAVFSSYEFAGYDESLILIFDKFRELVPELDNYEIYPNNSLYRTHSTGGAFATDNPQLERGKYTYAVSCMKDTGEETSPSIVSVDRRWWPAGYKGYNVLMWDEDYQSDGYNIYRGADADSLEFLVNTAYNVFVDTDDITANPTILPKDYNYSGIDKPGDLILYNNTQVATVFQSRKRAASTTIILYGTDDEEIPELQLTRIKLLLEKMVPPEILYTVIFANNSKAEILDLTI